MKHLSEHVGVNELPVEFLGTTWNKIEPIIVIGQFVGVS